MKFKLILLNLILINLLFLGFCLEGWGGTITGSKHDVSSSTNDQVCAFCHTPHNANPAIAPLWNRNTPNLSAYQIYSSATMNTTPSNPPSGVSLACLSCHDTVPGGAVNDVHYVLNPPGKNGVYGIYVGSCLKCHNTHGSASMYTIPPTGPDLRNDHPISMTYPSAAQDDAFNTPPDSQRGWSDVRLYNGKIECPTCHDPHDPSITPFLRKSNTGSQLCLTCHIK
jgi:predicted CXXCH cytochrome family protein